MTKPKRLSVQIAVCKQTASDQKQFESAVDLLLAELVRRRLGPKGMSHDKLEQQQIER